MMKMLVYPADEIWMVSLRYEMTFHGKLSRGSVSLCSWVAYPAHAKVDADVAVGAGWAPKSSETCKPKWQK